MILSRPSIRKRIAAGTIVFEPALPEEAFQPAGVQLRLDAPLLIPEAARVDFRLDQPFKHRRVVMDESGFELTPGMFLIAQTFEAVTIPLDVTCTLDGTSTLARHDVTTHQGASNIWSGHGFPKPRRITLEVFNGGPFTIVLYPGMPIGNLVFHLLDEPTDRAYDAGGPGFGRYFEDTMAPLTKPRG